MERSTEAGQDLSPGFPSLKCSWSSQWPPFPSCGECLSAEKLSKGAEMKDRHPWGQTSWHCTAVSGLCTPVPAAQLFFPELSLESFPAAWAWNYFSLGWCELHISHDNWTPQTNANYNWSYFGYKKTLRFYFCFNGLVLLNWHVFWILA